MARRQSRVIPWFGADTEVMQHYVDVLQSRLHVTVPFAGGCSILSLLSRGRAQHIVANDMHCQAINLYRVLGNAASRDEFLESLEFAPHHEMLLRDSQFAVSSAGDGFQQSIRDGGKSVSNALAYFISAWQARNGKCGTSEELQSGMSVRFTPTGGSSAKRWTTALESARAEWGPICERTTFICRDAFELLEDVADRDDCGIYCDPPWFDVGDAYRYRFGTQEHERLRDVLSSFAKTLVVIRYGDCPEVRKLYGHGWEIAEIGSRNQARNKVAELLIVNRTESAE